MQRNYRLPSNTNRRSADARIFEYEGQKYPAALGRYSDGAPAEIFLDVVGKAGSAIQQHVETSAILVSLLLQHGVTLDAVKHSISGPIKIALDLFAGERK